MTNPPQSLFAPKTATQSLLPLLVLGAAISLTGCNKHQDQPGQEAAQQPVAVEVQKVSVGGALITTEYPGRVSPRRVADIRSRVAGIVLKRHFTEGAEVKEGDLLFTIDPAPFDAALARAKGDLIRSEAQLEQAKALVDRYTRLVSANAISRQDYEDAVTARSVAEANVQTSKAATKAAALDLEYCTVRSPITGLIGASFISEGTLVVANDVTAMARVQQLDPVYVDVFQSVEAFTKLKESVETGALSRNDSAVGTVTVLVDGSSRKPTGSLLFSDSTVNPSTGQIALRAEVSNGGHLLIPGMYVRLQIADGVDQQSIYVPQRAVLRDQQGNAKLIVVGANSMAEERQVVTGLMKGSLWQIVTGLKAGDQVIINGADKVVPGTPLDPKPAQAAAQ